MDVYPEKFADNYWAKWKEVEARGKTYFSLLKKAPTYCSYQGTISTDSENPFKKENQRSVRPIH